MSKTISYELNDNVVKKLQDIVGGAAGSLNTITIYDNYTSYPSEIKAIVGTTGLSTYEDLYEYLTESGYTSQENTLIAAGSADVYGVGSGNVCGLFAAEKGDVHNIVAHTYADENLAIPNDETFSITYLGNE